MAEHTLEALAMAYVRYLMGRCEVDGEFIREAYFSETGNVPEGRPADFRKWAAHKVHMLDQVGINPFPLVEE
jgi:hypothetical protein